MQQCLFKSQLLTHLLLSYEIKFLPAFFYPASIKCNKGIVRPK